MRDRHSDVEDGGVTLEEGRRAAGAVRRQTVRRVALFVVLAAAAFAYLWWRAGRPFASADWRVSDARPVGFSADSQALFTIPASGTGECVLSCRRVSDGRLLNTHRLPQWPVTVVGLSGGRLAYVPRDVEPTELSVRVINLSDGSLAWERPLHDLLPEDFRPVYPETHPPQRLTAAEDGRTPQLVSTHSLWALEIPKSLWTSLDPDTGGVLDTEPVLRRPQWAVEALPELPNSGVLPFPMPFRIVDCVFDRRRQLVSTWTQSRGVRYLPAGWLRHDQHGLVVLTRGAEDEPQLRQIIFAERYVKLAGSPRTMSVSVKRSLFSPDGSTLAIEHVEDAAETVVYRLDPAS